MQFVQKSFGLADVSMFLSSLCIDHDHDTGMHIARHDLIPDLLCISPFTLQLYGLQLATDQVAKALKVQKGAVIQGIAPNSAAARAGLLTTRRGLTGIVPGDLPILFAIPQKSSQLLLA